MEGLIVHFGGYEAKVENILPPNVDSLDYLWHQKANLTVVISFPKPIESTIEVGLRIPYQNYSKEQFIRAVQEAGCHWLEKERQGKEDQERRNSQNREYQEGTEALKKTLGL